MSYPKNPSAIVFKNQFYPEGLTHLQIWNYYQKAKSKILQEVQNRKVAILLATEQDSTVLIRKLNNKPIRLTSPNYDDIISGRSLVIYSEMGRYENFGIIDIDVSFLQFDLAKIMTKGMYNYIEKIPNIYPKIRYTGKNSFHLICEFSHDKYIEDISNILRTITVNIPIVKKYATVASKKTGNIPNIDLGRNTQGALFITNHSLSMLGLKCTELSPGQIMSFRRELNKC